MRDATLLGMVIGSGELRQQDEDERRPRLSERERWQTNAEAASPAAMASPIPPKEPIANNDPERNLSRPEKLTSTLVVIFAFAALAILSALTLLLFL